MDFVCRSRGHFCGATAPPEGGYPSIYPCGARYGIVCGPRGRTHSRAPGPGSRAREAPPKKTSSIGSKWAARSSAGAPPPVALIS